VGIHVRRGDYLTDETTLELAGIADLSYYQQAVSLLRSGMKDPSYYVFTDDPEWVRNNFEIGVHFELVTANGQEKGFEDLRLLSSCKHQVISNSSFGWWGAWLNDNPGKTVIAPRVWRKSGPDMYKPENWIVL
jgi:hypothetical protein